MKPSNRTENRIASIVTHCLRLFWLLAIVFVFLINLALFCQQDHKAIAGSLLVECATAAGRPVVDRAATTEKSTPDAGKAGKQHDPTKRPQTKVKQASAQQSASRQPQSSSLQKEAGVNLWRATKSFRRPQNEPLASGDYVGQLEDKANRKRSQDQSASDSSLPGLQVSITPRVSLVRVPVESNAILKCLISSQTNKFTKPFKITWSRYRYDENDYEQIESELYDESGRKPAKREDEQQQVKESIPASPGATESLAEPVNRQQQLRDFLARSRQETKVISDLLIEASLSISPVKPSDNATYFCTATDGHVDNSQAQIDLLALSKPVVRLDRVQPARDSKTALVFWSILSDGNTPIKKTILMVRNDSHRFAHPEQASGASMVLDSDHNQWQRIDISGDGGRPQDQFGPDSERASQSASEDSVVRADVDVTSISLSPSSSAASGQNSPADEPAAGAGVAAHGSSSWVPFDNRTGMAGQAGTGRPGRLANQRAFNLSSLLPGVTYQLRLTAINDMGQSNWSQLVATMPNEIPAQISDIIVLSTTNDSITIGWRRPPYDGAKTIRYEMQLFDLNRTLTLDASTNTNTNANSSSGHQQTMRTNFMFHFVNLNPGTDYHFHIRACSRSGCSAYSAPRLLASTQDGEPDEPLDVELACGLLPGGHPTVTWLPPVNSRGRLINYSVTLEAQSRYRNQSGHWTSDDWRTTFETGDNHSLSFEASDYILTPNTNYTVRVCANNRSKKCGKLSQLSHKSACSVAAELPSELPANIRLSLKQINTTDVNQDKPQAETLVLELPFISWRNGSIDCIQIVLVKLPKSFDGARKALSDFLPDDPAEIEVHDYLELTGASETNSDEGPTSQADSIGRPEGGRAGGSLKASRRALAYLAEELDQINQSGSSEEISSGLKQILLGDGSQSSCDRIWASVRGRNQQQETRDGTQAAATRSIHPIQAIDGALIAQTHYTGFLKLVQLRTSNTGGSALAVGQRDSPEEASPIQKKRSAQSVELLTKYSNYFSPVKTGEYVPDVSVEALRSSSMRLLNSDSDGDDQSGGGFCETDLVKTMNSKLGLSGRPCEQMIKLAKTVHRETVSSFRKVAVYLGENLRFDSRNRLQLLEIGLLVFVVSILLLFTVYLILLPSSLKRKRKLKMRRQLQQHEDAIVAAAGASAALSSASSPTKMQANANCQPIDEDSGGFGAQQQIENGQLSADNQQQHLQKQQQQQQQDMHALASSLGYQQVPVAADRVGQPGYGTLGMPRECPIHSSPVSQVLNNNQRNVIEQREHQFATHQTRRQSVHVCQADQQLDGSDYLGLHDSHSHGHKSRGHDSEYAEHQQRHQHYKSAYQLHDDSELAGSIHAGSGQLPLVDDFGGRNCRTMRRPSDLHHHHHHHHQHHQQLNQQQQQQQQHYHGTANGVADPVLAGHYQQHLQRQRYATQLDQHQHAMGSPAYDLGSARQHQPGAYTMTLQHDPVLALAKKINKSIPLGLFQLIFECRLKNGWLREEYEQLPRQVQPNSQAQSKVNDDGRHIRLRPQLIVSRDDSVSALISGNDKYDGSLIRLQLPSAPGQADAGSDGTGPIEKQFICVKSPVDADSVWDFWRLVYEREVSTLVMLTPNEDTHTGQIRCAQYWPTCDNEETTILSPCNEFVQQSTILPAKFKIRQETVSGFEPDGATGSVRPDEFKIRRLTLLVMATRPSENEHTNATTLTNDTTSRAHESNGGTVPAANGSPVADEPNVGGGGKLADKSSLRGQEGGADGGGGERQLNGEDPAAGGEGDIDEDNDDESLVIIERNLLHFQFLHWNASSASNQMRLIKFIELVNERHSRQMQQQASPGTNWQQVSPQSPILVHCANGIGRSGLFTAMSFIIDDLSIKLATTMAMTRNGQQHQQMSASLNLYQLVSRLRNQRDMLLSPYRFYELLYQLTTRCIPIHSHHHAHTHNQNLVNNVQPPE